MDLHEVNEQNGKEVAEEMFARSSPNHYNHSHYTRNAQAKEENDFILGNPNAGWHTERLGATLGFSDDDIHVLKAEINRTFQTLFGGDGDLNVPEQFAVKQASCPSPSGWVASDAIMWQNVINWLKEKGYGTDTAT
jgi:hypothetical protein